MAWNGVGTYVLNPAYSPEVNGTTVDATRYNGLTSDIATGITQAVNKNGENSPTADIPWGGFAIKNVKVRAIDGNAGSPGMQFDLETSTGFYRSAAGQISASILGARVVAITAGRVGINGVPSFPLHVYEAGATPVVAVQSIDASGAIAYMQANAAVDGRAGTQTNHPFKMIVNSTVMGQWDTVGVIVNATSRVGVGATTDPLACKGSIGFGDGTATVAQLNGNSTTFCELVNRGAGGWKFYTNSGGVVAAWADTSGRWGFGAGQAPTVGYDVTIAGATLAKGVSLCAFKPATTSRSSNATWSADPDLQVSLPVGTYQFEAIIPVWCTTSNAGGIAVGMGFSGTSTASAQFINEILGGSGSIISAAGANIGSGANQWSTAGTVSTAAAAPDMVRIFGVITVSVAGTLQVGWSQQASNVNALNFGAAASLRCMKVS